MYLAVVFPATSPCLADCSSDGARGSAGVMQVAGEGYVGLRNRLLSSRRIGPLASARAEVAIIRTLRCPRWRGQWGEEIVVLVMACAEPMGREPRRRTLDVSRGARCSSRRTATGIRQRRMAVRHKRHGAFPRKAPPAFCLPACRRGRGRDECGKPLPRPVGRRGGYLPFAALP